MEPYQIAASILAADLLNLKNEVSQAMEAGANRIHFDVMDNHYVPNLSFGPELCHQLREKFGNILIDVHLMVAPVDNAVCAFAKAGANLITFHPEATQHVDRTLSLIKDLGCQAGLVFNPATPLTWLDYVWDKIDCVLIMSVNPGFGGQKFMSSSLSKIHHARQKIDEYLKSSTNNYQAQSNHETNTLSKKLLRKIRLEVDGGINLDNIASVAAAGADTFVAGSSIFKSIDYRKTICDMKKLIKAN